VITKLKLSFTGLGRPVGLQEVEASRISRESAHEVGKVVSPTPWPNLLISIKD
jgi:hypothetical protein